MHSQIVRGQHSDSFNNWWLVWGLNNWWLGDAAAVTTTAATADKDNKQKDYGAFDTH
jgi:hypothetical protein